MYTDLIYLKKYIIKHILIIVFIYYKSIQFNHLPPQKGSKG